MGIHDFIELFDQLDSSQRGFLTQEQIIQFHTTVCERDAREDLVHSAIERICGPDETTVPRELFYDVVSEIERRYAVDNEAYWDFRALDANGDDHISLTDALVLFQEYHGDQFSLATWHEFLQSREDPAGDVFFDEIRNWLTEVPPDCRPSSQRDIRKEETRLEQIMNEEKYKQLEDSKLFFGNEDLEREEQEDRVQELQHNSKRKLNIWKTHGLAAMLQHSEDYGYVGDDLDSERAKQREGVYTSDVLDALDMKYSMLQDKVLMEMASYAANMDSEKSEIFQQLKKTLGKIANSKSFSERVQDLPGAKMMLPMTLLGMLGDLQDAEVGRRSDFNNMRQDFEQDGKTEEEINTVMASRYQDVTSGNASCGTVIAQLRMRQKAEREIILSVLEKKDGALPPTVALAQEYWFLLRQLRLLKSEQEITQAGISVGIAERKQTYKPSIFDWDRQRSETLASLRLDAHRGHRLLRRSANLPDIDAIKGLNPMALKIRLVEEKEQQHFYEREALIYWLQGPESESLLAAASKIKNEDRKKRIRNLRSQRQEWKSTNNSDLSVNQKILQEAIGLYYEDRLSEIEIKYHNAGADVVKEAVLSDLQQMQEIEFWKLVEEIHEKNLQDLQKALLEEIESTRDEHFNNIAHVILGSVELSADDAEFIKSLDGKYKALRDQVLVFGLAEKLGSSWKELSKEDKQREILKVRKEEQRLRGEGNVNKLNSLIGPRSQALPNLRSLIGEDKTFSVSSPRQPAVHIPVNLLADLIPRYDEERELLLLWLKSDEAKALLGRVRRIHVSRMAMEKFAASMEADYETAMLFVGLLERIGSAISGRSLSDKDHQFNLAKKRAFLHQKVMNKQERAKHPPEEKSTPKDDDDSGWQAVYLRALLRRHHKEREIMLRLLQEAGLNELVEAAALMSPDEARARIKELQMKRDELDLNDEATREENVNILEEAGAIRTVGKKQALCKASGKAVHLDHVVHHLLAELQDLQDIELATSLNLLSSLSAQDLKARTSQEELAKKNGHGELVMKLFIKYDSDTNVAAFEELIEEKYGKLRIHLLNESLSQQHGAKAWAKMGQKQKSKILHPLMSKEATLWTEGNSENLSACLYPSFNLSPSFPFLIGMGRGLYHHAVQSAQPNDTITEDAHIQLDSQGSAETISDLHRRFLGEIDFIRNYISGSLDSIPSESEKSVLLYKLKWELNLIQWSSDFQEASLFTGLAERQKGNKDRSLQQEKMRAEHLASLISQNKREMSKKLPGVVTSDDVEKMQESVLPLLMRKHMEEWGIFMKLFSSSQFEETRKTAASETEQQRSDRLSALLRQRQTCELKNTTSQLTILEEALAVKKEGRRHLLSEDTLEVEDSRVMRSLLSDLIQTQLSEADLYMQGFVDETKEDAEENQSTVLSEISESHATNIAEIIFNVKDGGEIDETQLKEAVDGKYDALRDQLLIQALIDQLGEDEWRRLSEQERQRLLLELKLKERRLRLEGKYDELNALLGGLALDDERLRKLLGDDREEQERKLRERLERRKKRLAEGMSEEECDELEAQEIAQEEQEEQQKRKNILMYLDNCNEKEKEELLKRLAELDDERARQRQRQLEMIRLRREERRLREEDKFDAAAMVMGLSQNNFQQLKLSREEEKRRQEELARQRLEAARLRRLQGENLIRGETLDLPSDEENEATVSENVMKMVDRRHEIERNILIQLLDDATDGEERDEARIMTEEELQQGMKETEELYNLWKDSDNPNQDDRQKILANAAALSMEMKKRSMQAGGELASDEDVKVSLLAELQMQQEKEASDLMQLLTDADGERKSSILASQEHKLKRGVCDNVVNVLLTTGGEDGIFTEGRDKDEGEDDNEKAMVKALEKKYDAMKDKLIMEALIQQMGEADWSRLSDLEKQKKILELKRKERRLRIEGKYDEAAALLGQLEEQANEFNKVLGETEEEQRRLLQEKLEMKRKLREQREAEGLSADDETLDEMVEEEVKKKRRNVLENLDLKLEEEKAAILASLRNHTDQLQRERQRQMKLAKLKRDEKRLKQEETFDCAARIFAMHQESNEKMEKHIENERERQRQLAKARIEARKRQRAGLPPEPVDVIDEEITDDNVYLQENIKNCLENIHAAERDMLMSMFTPSMEKHQKKLMKMRDEDLKLQLMKLQKEYEAWERDMMKSVSQAESAQLSDKKKKKLEKDRQKRYQQLEKLLEQTLAYKAELQRRQLEAEGQTDSELLIREDILLKFLAELQQKQAASLEAMADSLLNKNKDELIETQKMLKRMQTERWFKSLTVSLFASATSGEVTFDDFQMESEALAEEFEAAKKSLLDKGQRDNIDVSALMKNLEMEHEQRRQALLDSHQRQREAIMQKRMMKKKAADDNEWDMSIMTNQIFANSQANASAAQQSKKEEKGRQNSLLQQRLQARRDARKQAEQKELMQSRESTNASISSSSRGRRSIDNRSGTPMGLARERTVIPAHIDMSEDRKKEAYNKLVQQELKWQQEQQDQHSKQAEMVRLRREERVNKHRNEAAALMSLGERQKTNLEKSMQDDRERQAQQMQEKVARLRESRSKSKADFIPEES